MPVEVVAAPHSYEVLPSAYQLYLPHQDPN